MRLAAIVADSDDAIISEDPAGSITLWNRAAERIFGYPEAEAIGRSTELIVPPDRSAEEENLVARIRMGDRVDRYETIRLRKNGERIHVSLTVSPLRSATGESSVRRESFGI